jgi:tRNA(Ile)-lysidine synthase TilS/MesJ
VVALAKTLNLKVSLFKLKMNLNDQNFEKKARDERYKIFHSLAQNKNSVYLGHHIDDSYEWSFMQKHRSSNYKSSLGIPLKNGVFRRPLHCLTKKQILNFAHDLGLNFMHDSSGADSRFDRNFLRNHIIPKLEKRYPHYLKHYVDQANDLARSLKLSSFESSPRPQILIDHCGGLNFLQLENEGHFLGQELFLENTVKHYFKGERKKLRNSLSQVIELQAKGKNGPHKIGNDIDVFCYRGIIQLVDRKARSRYQQWDQSINLDKEFQKLSSNTAFQGPGPYWVLSKSSDNHIMPSLKKDHPLFPNLFRQLKQKKLFLRPYSQLLIKAKKKGLDNWERDFISLM